MPADCSKEIYSSIEHLTRLNLIEETENGGFAIKNDRVRGVGASILAVGPRNISRTGIGEFLSDGDVIVRLSGASNLLGAAIEVFSDEQSGLSHLEPALTSTPRRGLKSLVTALLGLR